MAALSQGAVAGRTRVAAHVHSRLVDKLTPEQRIRLDTLVAVTEDGRQSPLDRLRDGPYLQSGPEISRAVDRLTEIRTFTAGLPELDRVPPGKAAALARFAGAAKAQAVARLPDDRRGASFGRYAIPAPRASTMREAAPYVGFLFRCYSTPDPSRSERPATSLAWAVSAIRSSIIFSRGPARSRPGCATCCSSLGSSICLKDRRPGRINARAKRGRGRDKS